MRSDHSPMSDGNGNLPGWPVLAHSESHPDAVLFIESKTDSESGKQVFFVTNANEIAKNLLLPHAQTLCGATLDQLPLLASIGVSEQSLLRAISGKNIVNEDVTWSSEQEPKTLNVQVTHACGGGAVVLIADVTRRKEMKTTLVESQQLFERIASSLPEFVLLVDPQETQVFFASKDLLNYLGYHSPSDQKLVSNWRTLVHPEDLNRCDDHRWKTIAARDGETVDTRFRLRTHRGDWRWLEVRSSVFQRDQTGKPVQLLISIHDVTSQALAEIELREKVQQLARQKEELTSRHEQLEYLNKQLAALATTDGLTGLYNYRALNDKLEDEVRRAKRYGTPLALVITDIDDFKGFNDQYGHPAGDERLRYFARTLTEGSRATDFVARYGGEEFAVVLPNTTADGAVSFAKSILRRMHEDTGPRAITASFGCVELVPEDQGKAELISRADKCLYAAKKQGKDRVVSEEKQDEALPAFI